MPEPTNDFSLENKVVIVTGASSGLGESFALAAARAGGKVALAGRRTDRLAGTQLAIEEIGGTALSVTTDVTRPEQCTALADATVTHFGKIDVLVNCAGLGSSVPASRETPAEFRRIIETNLMGSYWMSQACSKVMQPGSSIINVSSILAVTSVGLPQAAYSSSKAAIIGLTRDLAQQWGGRKGIRVNAVAPGFFPTEMTDEMSADHISETVARRVPLGRVGRLEECANAVVFLASDAASYITGVFLPVDGGLLTL